MTDTWIDFDLLTPTERDAAADMREGQPVPEPRDLLAALRAVMERQWWAAYGRACDAAEAYEREHDVPPSQRMRPLGQRRAQ